FIPRWEHCQRQSGVASAIDDAAEDLRLAPVDALEDRWKWWSAADAVDSAACRRAERDVTAVDPEKPAHDERGTGRTDPHDMRGTILELTCEEGVHPRAAILADLGLERDRGRTRSPNHEPASGVSKASTRQPPG